MIPEHLPQIGCKRESLGRLMPGVSARVLDESGEPVDLGQSGHLVVRSCAIPAGAVALEIGEVEWFDARISGHFDSDGFFIAQA